MTCKLIWHAGLGSEHTALGATFEGQELQTALALSAHKAIRAATTLNGSWYAAHITSSTQGVNRSSLKAQQHFSHSPVLSVTQLLLSV